MSILVIVESPGKIKKLKSFLGAGYEVMASVGHIRDLPDKDDGIAAPDYKPRYVVTRPDVVAKLLAAKKAADDVILASDPDREGEAIAFHLREALELKSPKRVVFNEITASAVLAAIANPRRIDDNLVHAQEARRVLDRLVGYRVSACLSAAAGQKLSAGRVQSPAVRIVVDREREIEAFKVSTHYGVVIDFENEAIKWQATWNFRPLLAEGATTWTDQATAEAVSGLGVFKVASLEKTEARRMPPAPFTTSSLLQAASIQLKFNPARTMELAQTLYQEGHISYHRTDTPNLSEEATGEIWKYLRSNGLADYVPENRHTWKAREGSQEAHEGIRPAHIEERTPDIADKDAASLYELIWLRSVACQMKPAVFDVTTVRIQSLKEAGGRQQEFVATGRVRLFDGWMKLTTGDATDEEAEKEADVQTLPAIADGAQLVALGARVQEKKTKPPARFSEAALVKELEKQGIGRPSTYATLCATISARGYVEEKSAKLVPTALGYKVIDALAGHFAFAELDYTREVEADLDLIAEGKAVYKTVVGGVNNLLTLELGQLKSLTIGESHPCECGGKMRRIPSPNGFFWGCSNYPECKISLPDNKGKPGIRPPPAAAGGGHRCPKCGKALHQLTASKGPNAGKKFWGCTGFAEGCKYSVDDNDGKPGERHAPAAAGATTVKCPKCGKAMHLVPAKTGRNAFWSCTGYPDCKSTADDKGGKPVLKNKEAANAKK